MLFQIKTINGQKTIVPLTADTGTGAPVGSLISMYRKSSPSGYLYCDGSTFDETKYPALYQYLGSNVLPDYREVVAVGAEQNTTDTIATHDVYTEGQFKDDQLQTPTLRYKTGAGGNGNAVAGVSNSGDFYNTDPTVFVDARYGTTTHGKQKAVFIYIKATSGLSENAQDNVINTLNGQRSYSTEEHLTGRKWLDGKPTYEITIKDNNINTTPKVLYTIQNLSNIAKIQAVYKTSNNTFPAWYAGGSGFNWARADGNNLVWEYSTGVTAPEEVTVTLEYTKTV